MDAVLVEEQFWERSFHRMTTVLPYVLLAASTLFTLVQPNQSWTDRLIVLGLVSIAVPWVYFGYPRESAALGLRLGYFVGLLALSALLTIRSIYFVAFLITAFVQSFLVLPLGLAVVVALVSSVLIYTAPSGPPALTFPAVSQWVFLIGMQTLGSGGFGYLAAKLGESRERSRKLVRQLQGALDENAGLHAQLLVQAREAGALDERHRMAGEIHDTLAQGLTGIVTQLEAARHAAGVPDQLLAHLTRARGLARDSLTEARRSVQALRPQPLEDSHLPDAVAGLARDWSAGSGVASTVTTTGPQRPLLADLEIALYRVAGEALANVAKHAGAGRVGITLSYMDDVVMLDVRDDGAGFAVDTLPANGYPDGGSGYGLAAMRRRLQRVAGTLEIESTLGEGTTISASVPAIARMDGS